MLKALLAWLGLGKPVAGGDHPEVFEDLNRMAPLRHVVAEQADRTAPGSGDTFLCREAVLGPDQRVAGYQFMLKEATRNRIRNSSRVVHHVYAEVLVRNLVRSNISAMLGHRMAFVDIPDSFLEHPCLQELPAHNTVLVVEHRANADAPPATALLEQVRTLRATGLRIGIADPEVVTELAPLLPECDFVVLKATGVDPARVGRRTVKLSAIVGHAQLLVRELATVDHLGYCLRLGAKLFQGPFITSREDWHENNLSPDMARLALLLGRLRQDADTSEIVKLMKQDPALSLRLLRYINSAAAGLPTRVASIEGALQLIGRGKLYRWLVVLFCSANEATGRSASALESALVRARMMELIGADRPASEQEALFLTGLLSLIDVVLQLPMERALAQLALTPEIEAAVRHHAGPYADLLDLAIACETAQSGSIEVSAQSCGITAAVASQRHLEALGWVLELQR